jgi:acetyl-CoA carboxylase biotin carboxyl carrier protein
VLSDDDVREILRLIDESPLDELRIETEGFSLHVLRGGAGSSIGAPEREPAAGAPAALSPAPAEADGVAIDAPMLGVFYRAEAPGATPFVDAGTHVEPETVVCLIEVMKMMNSVAAGVSGTIVEICAENGALVEYGQPLFRVEPGR